VSITSVQDLRRITEAVDQLGGCTIVDVEMRSDCRFLRLTLSDGQLLLISTLVDDAGKPRLDVDLIRAPEQAGPGQLEVPFDAG
jgi:hypothetical protein